MAKQTVLDEVKNRMKEMQDSKAAQLETIRQKQTEARSQIEAADLAMQQAREELNDDDYEAALTKKRKGQAALKMCDERYEQINDEDYISELESDRVIDNLIEYKKTLDESFMSAVAAPLKELSKVYQNYETALDDVKDTLQSWQRNIHANYKTMRDGAQCTLDVLGEKNHRGASPYTVEVYDCEGAASVEKFLRDVPSLIEG